MPKKRLEEIARGIAVEDGELPETDELAMVLDAAAGLYQPGLSQRGFAQQQRCASPVGIQAPIRLIHDDGAHLQCEVSNMNLVADGDIEPLGQDRVERHAVHAVL